MAKLDPRLLELIDTLVAARLDWLAFELVDGIRAGRQTSEPSEVLKEVRGSVRTSERPQEKETPDQAYQPAMPIEGDEQIEWAASYVAGRLDGVIATLGAAMDNLDAVRGSESRSVGASPGGRPGGPLTIVLDDEEARKAERSGVELAVNALPQLRASIMAWSSQVRGQVQI